MSLATDLICRLEDRQPHFVNELIFSIFGRPANQQRMDYLLNWTYNILHRMEAQGTVKLGRAMLWNQAKKQWRSQGTVAWLADADPRPRFIQIASVKLPIAHKDEQLPPPVDVREKAARVLPALLRRLGIEGLAREAGIHPRSVYRWSKGQINPTRKHAAVLVDLYKRTAPVQADHF